MIKNLHNTITRPLRSALTVLLVLVTAAVMADEVSVNSIVVDKDETATVDVNFDMTNYVVGLQMFIELPEGIEFAGGVTRNAERIGRDTHGLQYNVDGKTLKVVIVPINGDDAIDGASGKLFSFDVKATEDVYDYIRINNIMESTIDNGKLSPVVLDDTNAAIASMANTCILDVAETMTIREGETNKQKVSINLINGFSVAGMQFTVTLPQGLTPETNNKGRIVFSYGDRLPEDFSIKSNITENGSVKVVISNMTGEVITNRKSGEEILSFNVIADTTLVESSEILFSKGVVSNTEARSFELNDCVVRVINQTFVDRRVNESVYETVSTKMSEMEAQFDNLVNTIKSYTMEDAKALADGEEAQAIAQMLADLKQSVDEANAACTLRDADAYAEQLNEIAQAMATLDQLAADIEKEQIANTISSPTDDAAHERIYNMQGLKLKKLAKGLNIINGAKVLVK